MDKNNIDNKLKENIVNVLKCEECLNYLIIPIKIHIESNMIICGRCCEKYDEDDLGNVSMITKIGELLQFPCYFQKHGCREVCSWKEAEAHEHSCPFRQYKCPSLPLHECSWSGTPSALRVHYEQQHTFVPDKIEIEFEESSNENYLMEDHGELFLFQTKCDIDDDMLFYDVRFLGPPQRAARFHFKVELFIDEDERKYIERKQVEPDTSWELNEAESLGIRIAMVRAMLRNSDRIWLKVKVDVRVPLYNGKADQALMHEIECPVCKDHMIRPIRMCQAGHNICDNCFQKMTECPTCRGRLGTTRNISLETLSDHMHYRCMYFDEGCTFTDVPMNIKDHEMACEVSFYDCPLKQLVSCNWRGKVGHVCIHASKEHQFKF